MSGASVGGADFSEANLFRANLSKVFPGIGLSMDQI
ncbi:MAG: pentapeptide repeat-containing protein [Anaerolineales bacterium]|nr:pentapeptide repeat-containing protein [Anaerolineales bacterium]